jgi:glucuronoarabinoxylan endo-1,4-beta-xylanase
MREDLYEPSSYELMNNYPNPFNPITAIGYQLSAVSDVKLKIYNVLGQKVATLVDERQQAGHHQVDWDASRFPSGVYYYRLEASEFVEVKKMILLR